MDGAEGPDALADERKEMEELQALLPEIQEKVEDANESLKTASAAAPVSEECKRLYEEARPVASPLRNSRVE